MLRASRIPNPVNVYFLISTAPKNEEIKPFTKEFAVAAITIPTAAVSKVIFCFVNWVKERTIASTSANPPKILDM